MSYFIRKCDIYLGQGFVKAVEYTSHRRIQLTDIRGCMLQEAPWLAVFFLQMNWEVKTDSNVCIQDAADGRMPIIMDIIELLDCPWEEKYKFKQFND